MEGKGKEEKGSEGGREGDKERESQDGEGGGEAAGSGRGFSLKGIEYYIVGPFIATIQKQ